MKKLLTYALLASLGLALNGCQSLQNPESNRQARCKEMRSQMMFNGATTMQSQAFVERANQDKLNESFHDEDC